MVDDDVDDIVVEFVYRYAGYACAGIRSTTYQWTKQATHAPTCNDNDCAIHVMIVLVLTTCHDCAIQCTYDRIRVYSTSYRNTCITVVGHYM